MENGILMILGAFLLLFSHVVFGQDHQPGHSEYLQIVEATVRLPLEGKNVKYKTYKLLEKTLHEKCIDIGGWREIDGTTSIGGNAYVPIVVTKREKEYTAYPEEEGDLYYQRMDGYASCFVINTGNSQHNRPFGGLQFYADTIEGISITPPQQNSQ